MDFSFATRVRDGSAFGVWGFELALAAPGCVFKAKNPNAIAATAATAQTHFPTPSDWTGGERFLEVALREAGMVLPASAELGPLGSLGCRSPFTRSTKRGSDVPS